MDDTLNNYQVSAQKSLNHIREELKSIRTGKAHPSLVENLIVDAYGGQSKLKLMELSTIMADSASSLVITPYDQSTVQDIEKAVLKSPLGISPIVSGNKISLRFPALSEEQRLKLLKVVSQAVEEEKHVVRNHRDEARRKIKNLFESKEITEDEKFRLEKEIDLASQKIMDELYSIKEKKEKELMEI